MKDSNNNRYNNIIKNENILGHNISIFDAIIGNNIDINNLDIIDPNLKLNYKFNYKGEIGCYLSHLLLIKSIINNGFTVIFEDDFKILDNKLDKTINNIINILNENFDIVYLGNLNNNHNEHVTNNIYTVDTTNNILWGTHAYLINNKSAKKIYNSLLNMDYAVDTQLYHNIKNNIINAYVIYPILVDQNTNELKSSIRPIPIISEYNKSLNEN